MHPRLCRALSGPALLLACLASALAGGYRVVAVHPHDPKAFTQGLLIHEGRLYESTGRYGHSSLRIVDVATGHVLEKVDLPRSFFGEGIAVLDEKLYQLTWKNRKVFVYDPGTLERLETLNYPGEAWGLTDNGRHLILSDGSSQLKFLEPATLTPMRTLSVTRRGRPVERLNELEWVRGEIWANRLGDDRIARIDPESGRVMSWVDLGNLYPRAHRKSHQVLNGIAYEETSGRLYITGKDWPELFELEFFGSQ